MKKRKLKIIITLIIIIMLLTATAIYFIFYNPFLKIKIKGDNITLEVNEEYKELGAKVTGTKNKYTTSGKVNTKKLGTYTITYQIKMLKTKKKATRKITIIDTTKPTIVLNGSDITMYVGDTYQEPGYSITDNYDQDLNNKVVINNNIDNTKAGEYKITYEISDSSNNKETAERKITVIEKPKTPGTYIKGILIVNKKYSIPSTYNPGVNETAKQALNNLQQAAKNDGHSIPLVSGFRSYEKQKTLYNNYVAKDGVELADTYSARPGHSEHQTGLAFDVGAIDDNYGNTPAGIWLTQNAHKYGFIIRYLKGKENITGYKYEPWHIRYVGIEHATNIYNANITLEEYLGIA